MQENLQKAKQLINDSLNITILCSPQFQKDTFPASLALFYSLKKIGKNVNLLAENYPERFQFLVDEAALAEHKADFLISVREKGAKLANLFYEKAEGKLNIFLKTQDGSLNKEDISVEPILQERQTQAQDILITVGVDSLEKAEKALLDQAADIINISNDQDNKRFGEVNLIETEYSSFAEIVFDLLEVISENPFDDEQTANALLAGIVFGTNNFQSQTLTTQTLHKIDILTEKAANLKLIRDELYSPLDKSSLAIFGKILHKIEINENRALAVALLDKEDFSSTNSTSANLKFALRKLTCGLFPFESLLILWEQHSSALSIKGVFYSNQEKQVAKIAENFENKQKGAGIIFKVEEKELKKAKDRILKILIQD